MKLISPKRASVSLAADAGGRFTIVSVILPVARIFKAPPAVIPTPPFAASELAPTSIECIPPTFCVNPPLTWSVWLPSVKVFFNDEPLNSIGELPASIVIPVSLIEKNCLGNFILKDLAENSIGLPVLSWWYPWLTMSSVSSISIRWPLSDNWTWL